MQEKQYSLLLDELVSLLDKKKFTKIQKLEIESLILDLINNRF